MEKIEQDKEPLTDSEMEVRSNLSRDPRESLYAKLALEEAMKSLSKRQRECFKLVIEDGYTEREAAGLLGISNVAVHKHIEHAKEKVKKVLKGG